MLFMQDFETSTETVSASKTWVWAVCTTDIEKAEWEKPTDKLDYIYHSSFKDWLDWLFTNESSTVWFHNLKFDGSFITDYLLRTGWVYIERKAQPVPKSFTCLISDNNWFSITIYYDYEYTKNQRTGKMEKVYENKKPVMRKFTINDQHKKIPVSVDAMAKSYGLDVLKGSLDYEAYREEGHILTDEERLYISHDVGIVAKVMRLFVLDQNLTKLTMQSDALENYKTTLASFDEDTPTSKIFYMLFPKICDYEDAFVRKAYKGGWTFVNPKWKGVDIDNMIAEFSEKHKSALRELGFTNKQIEKAIIEIFDVNQLYPSRMYYDLLPVGYGTFYYGRYVKDEDYPLYVQHIQCQYKIKPNKFPMIQKSCGRFTGLSVYSDSSNGLIEDLYLTSVDLELFFETYDVDCLDYIDGYKYRGVKGLFKEYIDYWMEIKKTSKGAKRQIAKLMLNSLYGKFGTSKTANIQIPVYDKEKDLIVYKPKKEKKQSVYVPVAAFITSYARRETILAADACGDYFLYADTDSIHILANKDLPNIKTHQYDLGAWKLEGLADKGRYLRAKAYIENMIQPDGSTKLEVKCCGLNEKAKQYVNWENFHVGLKIESVNLKSKKIAGGTILKSTDFNIR